MFQFFANGLCSGAVYALVAVGFGLIFFSSKTFHIAHGAVYTAAAYACYGFLVPLGWPLLPAILAGLTVGVIVGVLTELSVYRPLVNPRKARNASPAILMVSSLGVYVVVVNFIAMVVGNDTKILRPGVEETIQIWGASITHIQIAQLASGICVLAILTLVLRLTQFGRTVRAFADDPELVSILGHNAGGIRLGIFAVGSFLAATGSILSAMDVGIDPNVGFHAVLLAAVATIIGGFGSFMAPALGALILGVLQSLVVWQTSQKWSQAVVFGLFILVLLVRPHGILATRKRLEEA